MSKREGWRRIYIVAWAPILVLAVAAFVFEVVRGVLILARTGSDFTSFVRENVLETVLITVAAMGILLVARWVYRGFKE